MAFRRSRFPASAWLLLMWLLVACNQARKSSAPVAPQSFSAGVHVGASANDAGGRATVFDAGRALDGGVTVCTPGQQSIGLAFSASDPCNQSASSCSLSGATAVASCQADGRWDTACYCFTFSGAAGAAGLGFVGSGGFGAGGLGF